MIDEIDRRTLMQADTKGDGDRRSFLFWLLWVLLIFTVLFGCGQTAMWLGSSGLKDVDVRSGLTVDYGIWTPVAFGGINPLIVAEAASDNGGEVVLALGSIGFMFPAVGVYTKPAFSNTHADGYPNDNAHEYEHTHTNKYTYNDGYLSPDLYTH